MELFDTHTHMYLKDFDEDRGACMQRAAEAGIHHVALPNIDRGSIKQVRAMMAEYSGRVIGMMGLHPCYVKDGWEEELTHIRAELDRGGYHAVGEIGIDLYWDKSTQSIQEQAFKVQIGWAREKGLPIAIHARDSFAEICDVLDTEADEKLSGVFHCFTGNVEDAERALGYPGFFLGIGGVATFKNSGLDLVIAQIGLERVVLETDAPYLAPTPFRGKRNETAYTAKVALRLAEITGLNLDEVARITTRNAKSLFNMPSKP